MTRKPTRSTARFAGLTAVLLAQAGAAQAQPVEDFSLPPASPSPRPSAAGPVDSEHPVAAPTPVITPAPMIMLPPPQPTPAPQATQSTPATPRRAEPVPRPLPQAAAAPTPAAPTASEAAAAAPTPEPAGVLTTPTEATAEPQAVALPAPWPWYAGGAAVVLLALFLILRRKGGNEEEALEEPFEPEAALEPEPQPGAPAAIAPRPEPAPSPPPLPQPAARALPLEVRFEPRHLSRAMVNATLAYKLTLTNRSDEAFGPLRISGDMITAHASLSQQDQLAPADDALATIHEVPTLPAGASVTLSGELRLPIAAILPIHSGASRVFVPLARFRASAGNEASTAHVFVVGQVGEQPGGALRPFVLDRGPGIERDLGQRELGVPA